MNGRSVSKKIKQHQGIKITYDVKLNEISSIDVHQNFTYPSDEIFL